MGDQPEKDPKPSSSELVSPPKDLPSSLHQIDSSPANTSLPPLLQQPKIVVAPPTPCPITSPTDSTNRMQFVMPEAGQENSTAHTAKSTPAASSNAKRETGKSKSASKQSKPIPINLDDAEDQLGKLETSEEESGVFGWLQKRVNNSTFLSKVADKAKTSMDSVLTTLDPGMKDFLKRDGNLDIVIASDNARIITAIADGFRRAFNTLSHRGMGTPGAAHLQPQIIGHSLAIKYMNERITLLRSSGLATPKSAVVVFQSFLHEIEGEWYESAIIGVQKNVSILHVYTQPVLVENAVIAALKNHIPKEFASGAFATTVGNAYAEVFATDPDDWQMSRYSVSSSESYRIAAAMLAFTFKEKYSRM